MSEARHVEVAGRRFDIAPVRVGDLPAFLEAVGPVASELSGGDLMGALARHAGRIIDAVAIGAGVERAWLEAQTADVLVELAAAVMEVNADFFARSVLPAIERAAGRLESVLAEAGGAGGSVTGSSSSAAPGSATAT